MSHKHHKPGEPTDREILRALIRGSVLTNDLLAELILLIDTIIHPPRPSLNLTFGQGSPPMPQTITNSPTASIVARIAPKDAQGNPTTATLEVWVFNTRMASTGSLLMQMLDPAKPVGIWIYGDPLGTTRYEAISADGFTSESDTIAVIDAGSVPPPPKGRLGLTFDAPTA